MPDRRAFLERLGAGAMLAALPLPFSLGGLGELGDPSASRDAKGSSPDWDLSWTSRVTGKYRAVFDVADIEGGSGVFRATVWKNQYADVLKAAPAEITPVVVIRAKAIALAMQQAFWDEYQVGKELGVKHPMTNEVTDRNVVLLSSTRNEAPAMYDNFALDRFIAAGGIALACDLALHEMIAMVSKKHGGTDGAARERTVAMLVPGVILQPSGVFAAIRAQDVGCKYIRAS